MTTRKNTKNENAKSNNDTLEKNNEINSLELKTIELRIEGIKDATNRSRFIFIVMTVVTATILIGLWNATLSWDKEKAFQPRSENELIAENQKNVTAEWHKNKVISVGLLGIRISTTDLAFLGSATLIIIMVWFFFCQRRENRAIVSLLRHCYANYHKENNPLSKDVCNLVYVGIVQNIVFIDMGGGDKPITGFNSNEDVNEPNSFIRRTLKWLVFLPPFTILMIIISDISSLFLSSYVRDSTEPLWKVVFDGNHKEQAFRVIIFDTCAILSCIYTWIICKKCREFSKETGKTIREFYQKILNN